MVVICLESGFDDGVMLKYGYSPKKYYRGTNCDKKFVGWNGKGTENKSSKDILEEILTFESLYITDKGKLVSKVYYREEYLNQVEAKVKPLILAFPRSD